MTNPLDPRAFHRSAIRAVLASALKEAGPSRTLVTMMNKYSIKARVRKSPAKPRLSDFDGPWAATVAAAVTAFASKFEALGYDQVVDPFIAARAEEGEEGKAGSKDSKGVYYDPFKGESAEKVLEAAGLKVL